MPFGPGRRGPPRHPRWTPSWSAISVSSPVTASRRARAADGECRSAVSIRSRSRKGSSLPRFRQWRIVSLLRENSRGIGHFFRQRFGPRFRDRNRWARFRCRGGSGKRAIHERKSFLDHVLGLALVERDGRNKDMTAGPRGLVFQRLPCRPGPAHQGVIAFVLHTVRWVSGHIHTHVKQNAKTRVADRCLREFANGRSVTRHRKQKQPP